MVSLPTMTRNKGVSMGVRERNLATLGWMKLWVLPLSIRTVTRVWLRES